ncbi:MAG: PhoH family protein [Desulfarculaceae bacterium]|nr:PhoH family protein [Desulfarculaceae bacterium]
MSVNRVVILDTSTLVHDPLCMDYLIENRVLACIPWVVLEELDGLKKRTDVGFDAREAIRNLEKLRREKSPYLKIAKETEWAGLEVLDRRKNDHKIIAAANAINKDFANVKIVSKDSMMRIKVRELGFEAQDYYRDQVDSQNGRDLPRVEVDADAIDKNDFTFAFLPEEHGDININEGVVCVSDWAGDSKRPDVTAAKDEHFAAVRIDDQKFRIVPNNIQAFGIRPYTDPEKYGGKAVINWPQTIALFQLTRPDTALVFLEGGSGTGKTLLALAAALEQRRDYRQILITRPMVHLEDTDNMGYLPGDVREKMDPWLRPIWQNLSILKDLDKGNSQLVEKLLQEKKIDIEPLDYIRGTTFWKCLLIIDEAQNLTPHQMKTIITRAGMGTRIIFTGDLDQIDRKRRLDKVSSGLAYAMSRLGGQKIVASVKFEVSVRSELAKIGVELL